jgi:uncharacterized membrane protein YhaH (DUF805 family)
MTWHIQQNGQIIGPYSDEQLKALCEAGVVNASTRVWKSDLAGWKPLAETDFVYRSILMPPPLAGGQDPRFGADPRYGGGTGYSGGPVYHGGTGGAGYSGGSGYAGGAPQGENLSIWQYYVRAIGEKYVGFHGRATRKEYWSFVLFSIIFLILGVVAGSLIDAAAGNLQGRNPAAIATGIFYLVYILAMLLPNLALSVRRLHDVGLSGWLAIVSVIVPLFGLVIALIPSEENTNKHGPCPRPNRYVGA